MNGSQSRSGKCFLIYLQDTFLGCKVVDDEWNYRPSIQMPAEGKRL